MYRQKTVYETADRKTHEIEKKAFEHSLDLIRETISKELTPLIGGMTHTDIFKIVMALVPEGREPQWIYQVHAIFNYGVSEDC